MSRCVHIKYLFMYLKAEADMFTWIQGKNTEFCPFSCVYSWGLAAEGVDSGHRDPRDRGDPAVWDSPAGGQPDHLSL